MQRLVKYLSSVDPRWLTVWIVIYVGFLLMDAITPGAWYVTTLKYGGIVLCTFYAFQKFKKDNELKMALLFTMLADAILIIDSTSILGVFVFCIAQFFHFARFRKTRPYDLTIYLAIVILVFFFGVLEKVEPMFVVAGIYGVTLLLNLFLAQKWHHKKPSAQSMCAETGFTLFLLCDICVAFSYLSLTGRLVPEVYAAANYFSWVFYFPAQVLIANSSKTAAKKSP